MFVFISHLATWSLWQENRINVADEHPDRRLAGADADADEAVRRLKEYLEA